VLEPRERVGAHRLDEQGLRLDDRPARLSVRQRHMLGSDAEKISRPSLSELQRGYPSSGIASVSIRATGTDAQPIEPERKFIPRR
jgi:hypothetical protein